MNRARALKLLGLGQVFDPSDVREAYAAAVMGNHPDMGGDGASIADFQAAKNFLLDKEKLSEGEVLACKMCRGSGYIRARIGTRRCPTCDGTGDRRG